MTSDSFGRASASVFLRDFARIAGKKGIVAAGYILAGAVLEGIGISLLVPLLGILYSEAGIPQWLRVGTAAAFALAGAHARVSRLTVLLGIFAVLIALRAIVVSARDFAIFRLQLEFVETQQMRTATALAAAKWEYLAGVRHARVSHIISADVQKLGVGIHFALRGAVAVIIFAVQCALAFLLAPLMAAIVALLLVLGALGIGPMLAKSRSLGDFVADANLSLLDTTTQFMGGLKLAVSQDLQTAFVRQVHEMLKNLADRQMRFARQQALGQSGLIALFGVMGAAAVCAGLFWLQIAPSVLIAFLLVVTRMTAPVEQIHQAAPQITHLLAVYRKIQLFQRELTLATRTPAIAAEAPYPDGNIIFENVTYQHESLWGASRHESPRGGVRELDLVIKQGEFLGVTGASGVGKTTFADLLVGLYPPQSGEIVVGHRRLDGAVTENWRRGLAYVPQDPFLFHDTIRHNLAWANPEADEADMWRALTVVGAGNLVRQMERGLESVVGERGALVSGGERQRIALARALLRNPRLLILDEATSALDSNSESRILAHLSGISPRPTIVVIAQRTEHLTVCDRVIRLEIARNRTVASAIRRLTEASHSPNAVHP